jgi:hypothetical protein
MTRFAWLQTRTQTLVAAIASGVVVVAAVITGIHLTSLYASLVTPCAAHGDCGVATSQYLSYDELLQRSLSYVVLLVPVLVGVFWGAPLIARELETGTYRLAWTQTITRSRWAVTKLVVGAAASVVLAGLLTVTVTWWYRHVDTINANRYDVFDTRHLAPIGYTLFAFALGALVGAVLRRPLPAMATTLFAFVAVRLAVLFLVRPHLLPTSQRTLNLADGDGFGLLDNGGSNVTIVAQGSAPTGGWTLSSQIVDASGHTASSEQLSAFVHQSCPNVGFPAAAAGHTVVGDPAEKSAFQACAALASRTYHLLVTYQPATHYWGLQWLEAGLYVLLALLAAAGCWWIIRRA